MDSKKIDKSYVFNLANEMSANNMVSYDDLPKYDLFLSQVIDYLNDTFSDDNYTNNIVQNYIKNDIISKPEDGKKRGYTKDHLVQLVLLSHMRPVLTTEEIKNVFSLAFNDINNREDDIISWGEAYKLFSEIQKESFSDFLSTPVYDEDRLNKKMEEFNLNTKDSERIKKFILVMSLVAQASVVKKMVQRIVNEHSEE